MILIPLTVSNPFIAGHSFLPDIQEGLGARVHSFKPLHSGAFLLTLVSQRKEVKMLLIVSNPFIAGHSFLPVGARTFKLLEKQVSNPFIAGHSFLPLYSFCFFEFFAFVSNPFIAGHSFLPWCAP